jgi:hypothetical protein
MGVEKGMKPNWPPIYTILKVASMTLQPIETYALYKQFLRLCKVQYVQFVGNRHVMIGHQHMEAGPKAKIVYGSSTSCIWRII